VPKREAEVTSPYRAEVKNKSNFTSLSCLRDVLKKHTDNFLIIKYSRKKSKEHLYLKGEATWG
jgi:hypothetical protein